MTPPKIPLSDGTSIPQLGFGVFQIPPDETAEAVPRAIDVGAACWLVVGLIAAFIASFRALLSRLGEAIRFC